MCEVREPVWTSAVRVDGDVAFQRRAVLFREELGVYEVYQAARRAELHLDLRLGVDEGPAQREERRQWTRRDLHGAQSTPFFATYLITFQKPWKTHGALREGRTTSVGIVVIASYHIVVSTACATYLMMIALASLPE